jgi:FkbM family methyltransferase
MDIIQVGCHTGKDEHSDQIKKSESAVLIDANPNCIKQAEERYKDYNHIFFETIAVIPVDIKGVEIELFQEQNKEDSSWASVNPDFVAAHCHHSNLKSFQSKTTTLSNLLVKYPKTDTLIVDTEGLDFLNLLSIENILFNQLNSITFEYIHSDGIVQNGPKLDCLLGFLTNLGFKKITQQDYNLKCDK